MIVSHKHKFIFVAIPKTATHAIRIALREHLGNEDMEQVSLFEKKVMPYDAFATIEHGHISCEQAKAALGEKVWNEYFKFAFVRNPFDRFISYCAFINRNDPGFKNDPSAFLFNTILNKKNRNKILFKSQHSFVSDKGDNLMVDFIGRFETLQNSYDEIALKIGIPSSGLNLINNSEHEHYSKYYNKELIELVKSTYLTDFGQFSYEMDLNNTF